MNNIYIYIFLLLIGFNFNTMDSYAQGVGINTSGNAPDNSAIMDIASPDKGFLIPRMDSSSRQSIINPAQGLMVFDIDYSRFYFHNGNVWKAIAHEGDEDDLGNHIATQNLVIGNNLVLQNSTDTTGFSFNPNNTVVFESKSAIPAQFKSISANGDASNSSYIEVNNKAGTRALFGADGNGFSGGDTTDVVVANWSSGALKLYTSAAERMRISETGNVGIDETVPTHKLHVNGTMKVIGAVTTNASITAITGGDAIKVTGANGTSNTILREEYANAGAISLYNDSGSERMVHFVDTSTDGAASFGYGPASSNYLLGNLSGYSDNGFMGVGDSASSPNAGMYIDSNGDGIVYGTTKNFRIDHPQDETKEIWYACIEGPEAAAYVRGTAQLVDGQSTILFPEHFVMVANLESLTLTLTPNSANSKGLAVVEKTAKGFTVKELFNGTGSYSFDWVAMGVRIGQEDYQVIREKRKLIGSKRINQRNSKN